jgi:phosphodiesterase/alkaline phosphatase D-like protein
MIKAIAHMTGLTTSPVTTATYTITTSAGNPPTVFLQGRDSITETSVRLFGSAQSLFLSAVTYFECSTDPSFVVALRTPDQVVTIGTITYSATISGLTPSNYYYCRMVATNAAGTSYSPEQPFLVASGLEVPRFFFRTSAAAGWPLSGITESFPPLILSITQSSADLNSIVYSGSQPATVYWEYDTDFDFSNASRTPEQNIGITPTFGTSVSTNLSGLSPATTYYIRLVAINATGKSNGMIIGFRTLP